MPMSTLVEILAYVVGTPTNDYEHFVLYMGSVCVSVLFIYAAINIFYMIGTLFKGR